MEHILPEKSRVRQSLRGCKLIKSIYEMEILIPVTIGLNKSAGLPDLGRYIPAFGCGGYLYPANWCIWISFPDLFYQIFKKLLYLFRILVALNTCNIIGHENYNGFKLLRFDEKDLTNVMQDIAEHVDKTARDMVEL